MAKKKYDSSEGVWRTIGGRRVFIKTGQSLSDAMKESGKFKRKGYTNEDYQKQENNIAQLKREYNALLDEEIDYQKDWDISEDPSPELEMTAWEREAKEEALREAQNKYREMEKNPYVERKYGVNKQELSNLKGINRQDDYEYNLYQRAKLFPDTIDPMTENSTDWEALEKKYGERFKNDKAKVDLKNAEVMLKGSQRSLEFERDGLARAKRDGQSVENISDRTRRVHDLELEVQKGENYYNKLERKYEDTKAQYNKLRGSDGKAIDFNRKDDTFKYNGSYNDNMMNKARQDSIMVEKLGSKAVEEIRNGNITDESQLNDYLNYGKSTRSKAKPGYGYGYYELQRNITWRDDLRNTKAYEEITAQADYWTNKAKSELQQRTLPQKYKGTVEYLQSTTNMTIPEIYELLKRIDKDKK